MLLSFFCLAVACNVATCTYYFQHVFFKKILYCSTSIPLDTKFYLSQICAAKKDIPTQGNRSSCAKSFVVHVHPVIFCGRMIRAQKCSSGRQSGLSGLEVLWVTEGAAVLWSYFCVCWTRLTLTGATFWLWSFCSQPPQGEGCSSAVPCIWWGVT